MILIRGDYTLMKSYFWISYRLSANRSRLSLTHWSFKSSISTPTSNQCCCFFFSFFLSLSTIKMWRREIERCSCGWLQGGLRFIVFLWLYWGKCEKWEAEERLQDYLSRPCCNRHSDVACLMFLQTLDLRGKDLLYTSNPRLCQLSCSSEGS